MAEDEVKNEEETVAEEPKAEEPAAEEPKAEEPKSLSNPTWKYFPKLSLLSTYWRIVCETFPTLTKG